MNMNECLGRLSEIKAQLDQLEKQMAERIRHEESKEAISMEKDRTDIDRRLAQLELKNAQEKLNRYNVS
ncbi:hypothetical protein ACFSCZ_10510 [Siminovitchia sediminis]|uniref:YknX-like alpha-helical hairpin domain-containing protein n=1 Tax=Siminovitchia sediminis TaxID=1274353 RepID=A0ABW4KHH1_9BACI